MRFRTGLIGRFIKRIAFRVSVFQGCLQGNSMLNSPSSRMNLTFLVLCVLIAGPGPDRRKDDLKRCSGRVFEMQETVRTRT